MLTETPQTIHATAVCHAGGAVLLTGPSGAGKSALALQLMALGAHLIADDRVILTAKDGHLIAACPPTLLGLVEARGVGILNVTPAPATPVLFAVDMGCKEEARMPPHRDVTYLGHNLPLLWCVDKPHFPATLLQFLSHGRSTR